MKKNTLQLQQISRKLKQYPNNNQVIMPSTGWIYAIRNALGMSLQQIGNKMSITRQSAQKNEKREKDGTITINALREVAKAMDMQLVYALVPVDGSLEALIDRKAKELATEIVMRTSNTMKLEDQENTVNRINTAIQERAESIKLEMPKILWD